MVSSSFGFGWIFVLIRIFISEVLRLSFLLLYTLLHDLFYHASPTCYWFPWLRMHFLFKCQLWLSYGITEKPKYQNSKQFSWKKKKLHIERQELNNIGFLNYFPLLFLNAAFLMLCSLFVPVFFSRLFSLCLFCLKCGAIWSILMVHDNYFNFLIHPCWRQHCSTLKCCLWAHIDVRGDDVFVLLLYLKLLSSFLGEMTTFIIILDGLKPCTVQNQLQSINDNNLQADADNC